MALLNTEQRKNEWREAIFKEYPQFKGDSLKSHLVEQMIESYLADEKKFKEHVNKAKKENQPLFKEAPAEIVAITKIEAEDKKEPVTVTFDEDKDDDTDTSEDEEIHESDFYYIENIWENINIRETLDKIKRDTEATENKTD